MSKYRHLCFFSKEPVTDKGLRAVRYTFGQVDSVQGVKRDGNNPHNVVLAVQKGRELSEAMISAGNRHGLVARRTIDPVFDYSATVKLLDSSHDGVRQELRTDEIEVPRNDDGTWSFPRNRNAEYKAIMA